MIQYPATRLFSAGEFDPIELHYIEVIFGNIRKLYSQAVYRHTTQ
jgi:hypothetical protein